MSQDPQHEALQFEAPSLEKVASLLPNYTIDALIAKGGMGAVYKATQTSLDRPVAIKVLPIEFGNDLEFRESFQSEAKLMARLNHPNLIGIYDFGEMEGMLYIVMELVEGKSLYEKAYRRAIKQETALKLTRDICDGLDHAHSAGILHRDIKPANILLKDKRPKIGDFGLARPTGNAETGVIFGTPGYTAPEVISDPAAVDQRADIFSVGIMLYELLTGEKPDALYTPVTDHVHCHPQIDKIIRKAIHPHYSARYNDAAEMSEEITELLREIAGISPAKPQSPASKLITGASTPVAVTPATRMKIGTGAQPIRPAKPKLATQAQPVRAAATLATPPSAASPLPSSAQMVNTSGNSAVARNIVIILILLVAIYVAHSMLTKKEKDILTKEQRAKEEQEQRKKEKADLIASQQLPSNTPNQPNPNTNNTTDSQPTITEKTPQETLDDLRTQLLSGTRSQSLMPKGTFIISGSRMLLFLDKPMNWHAADRFARKYGAYLATLKNSSDTTILASKIPSGKQAWLGAGTSGNKQWSWSDGTPSSDALDLGKTSKHRFIKLGNDAYPTPADPGEELPVVLEWRMDGTQPGSLQERLLLTRQTMSQIDAIYPPGTISVGSRHFFLAPMKTTLAEARELAEIAGAKLHVPSDQHEIDSVASFITESLPQGEKAWIGGTKNGEIWSWLTGESWNTVHWDHSFPTDQNALAITSKPSAPWQDVSATSSLNFALLEWSKDKADIQTDSLNGNANTASLGNLNSKAKEILLKRDQQREEDHKENLKRLTWDIDTYFKGLPKNDKFSQQTALEELKIMIHGKNRIPDEMANLGPTAKVQGMTSYAHNKQTKIEKEFLDDIEKIRIAYIGQLKDIADQHQKKSQISAQRAALKEIDDAGNTPEGFLDHMEF